MLDIIAEFLIDAIGDLFESGAETAAEAAADAVTDIGVDAALDTGVDAALDSGVDALDPGAALAPPIDAAAATGGGVPVVFENHPVSATLRSAGIFGQV
jgi:hypothetical protein